MAQAVITAGPGITTANTGKIRNDPMPFANTGVTHVFDMCNAKPLMYLKQHHEGLV